MTALIAALRLARSVPWWAWLAAAACGLVTVNVSRHLSADRAAVTSAYAKGRTDVLDSLARIAPVAHERARVAAARTDTVILRVTKRIASVETLTVLVPDSVRRLYPSVDSALNACTALANDCGTLRATVQTERAVRDTLETVLKGAIVTQAGRITTLERDVKRRWSKPRALGLALLTALAGYGAGATR